MARRILRSFSLFLGLFVLPSIIFNLSPTLVAYAEELQSQNYTIREGTIGSGGLNQSSSDSYLMTDTAGDIGVGDSTSDNYNLSSGSNTPSDPTLAFAITSGTPTFPTLSASSASMTTATFSVINYTSYGYVVQVLGTTPTNDGYVIPGLAENAASEPGTEQFGINLVANTSPENIGANPDNGDYGFGEAAVNYNTPNEYRFVNGETIALAPKSSGQTDYTISYLINVAGLTPGGQYRSAVTLVVVGTY